MRAIPFGLIEASRQLPGPAVACQETSPPKKINFTRCPDCSRIAPVILVGHTCLVCEEAIIHTGAVGPSALERSLVAHLVPDLVGKLGWGSLEAGGLHGWAIVAFENEDTPPNQRPWMHLGDFEELPGKLRSALGG
jgi:hypothetical protein